MGFSVSWIAVKDKNQRAILDFYGFSETDEKHDMPESELCASVFPNGWFFIWFNEIESPYLKQDVLASLSLDCTVIACVIDEHCMYSSSEYWINGEIIWKVFHDSHEGMYSLNKSGSLPDFFNSLESQMIANQELEGGKKAEVDLIFEIPLETARRITGFKHDEEMEELAGVEYMVLKNNNIQKTAENNRKPWWRIW